MSIVSLYLSLITVNANGLVSQIKRQPLYKLTGKKRENTQIKSEMKLKT